MEWSLAVLASVRNDNKSSYIRNKSINNWSLMLEMSDNKKYGNQFLENIKIDYLWQIVYLYIERIVSINKLKK